MVSGACLSPCRLLGALGFPYSPVRSEKEFCKARRGTLNPPRPIQGSRNSKNLVLISTGSGAMGPGSRPDDFGQHLFIGLSPLTSYMTSGAFSQCHGRKGS